MAKFNYKSSRYFFKTFFLISLTALGAMVMVPFAVKSQVLKKTFYSISPFCKVLSEKFGPYGAAPDLSVALGKAIAEGGNLNQTCDILGEKWLPLNVLLSTDESLAERLIQTGVNVNAKDGKGDTPLHYLGKSEKNARLLLSRGAKVNVRNRRGNTPLHNVFGEKTAAVIKLLIDGGANVNARNQEQMTPLHLVPNSGKAEITELLIRSGADINARSNQDWTPLHYAASHLEIAKKLIEAGADLTIQNRQGAVIHSQDINPTVLQLLLDRGVDVNLRNAQGQTPLHVNRFQPTLVKLLLERGAKVNIQDAEGKTPLYDVNLKVGQLLVAANADLNVQDNLGRTPLHQAVLEEQSFFGPELVTLFLSKNAKFDLKDKQGKTALDLARQLNKTQIINLLEQHIATKDSAGSGTTTTKATAKLQQLLNSKNWSAADQETRRLLSPQKDLFEPNAATIPLDLIQEIDQAWLVASDGRFGLSIQAKIWQEVIASHPNNSETAANTFRDRVGWKLQVPRTENDFISSDWLNESELTYSLNQAPLGHLPWAGVSDAAVLSVAVPPPGEHCGSCTVDAMFLRDGRFYKYLPQLFAQVQMALNTSVPKK
ncbi:ankyrin repeat domain-containing protein [Nodularia harveyana UHCC-0300]|uniref:Ankyrin repeat domain-containing protein n=1 Tax=Nodularia harveyana UHCC-0300 TaxID=2974287 RepID=A0ABU5UEM9_9CYAN|nr:ankyrin repeat domain-containing protein [Nodularia harveyana]MEA5582008.1 ankyrin repeat domain-containing protein [Nodularia harveyana UHCC-0300]